MRRLRDIHVWLVGYDMVSLSLYHILVLARFIYFLNLFVCLRLNSVDGVFWMLFH